MINFLYLFVGLSNPLLSANMVVILNDRKIHVSFEGSLGLTSMVSLVSVRSGRWAWTQILISEVADMCQKSFSKVCPHPPTYYGNSHCHRWGPLQCARKRTYYIWYLHHSPTALIEQPFTDEETESWRGYVNLGIVTRPESSWACPLQTAQEIQTMLGAGELNRGHSPVPL